MTLPQGFLWGAATAAFQIEGAAAEDGRGESIWDRFCATPGKVRGRDTGEIACDFYHRHADDIALMRELGLDAFRFSISWPRVLPEGRGRVNEKGLDFYDRLVDELLAAGITPFATLYHWDLPQALEDEGGWPVRATAEAFVEYVSVVAARLGDRVPFWGTHNEPAVTAWLGYGYGIHAPGRTSWADAVAASHHVLLSHGWATEVLRRESPGSAVGITLDLYPIEPATGSEADAAAAREMDARQNRWFLDALFRGRYPDDLLERFAPDGPPVQAGDFAAIGEPVDYLGVNNYSRMIVRTDAAGGPPVRVRPVEGPLTTIDWEVHPVALRDVLRRVHEDYEVPALYVTENGAAFSDVVTHDGRVHDVERVAYLEAHIDAVCEAVEDGAPVRGYFVWSLLDNFEWALGYSQRFGIVYVDYPTQARIPKDSFEWYRRTIAARARQPVSAATG